MRRTAGTHKPWIERIVGSRKVRSGYLSLVAHMLAGILLAVVIREAPIPVGGRPIVIRSGADVSDGLLGPNHEPLVEASNPANAAEATMAAAAPASETKAAPEERPDLPAMPERVEPDGVVEEPFEPRDEAVATAADPVREAAAATIHAVSSTAIRQPRGEAGSRAAKIRGGIAGKPFSTRRGTARGEAVRIHGGTAASEAAVERGLEWLAAHQCLDGSWRCDLSGCRCDGACRDPGSISSTTASTAIALLPFLGAGSTHQDGPYHQTVSKGVYYLASRMKQTSRGGDLCEGTMYGQGIATLVLTEALGMTGDDLLRPLANDAIRFIETAQDQYSGGWRYLPGQSGDITITAWQLAALKSGGMAGLAIPSPSIDGAVRFLDRVQSMRGAAYGYRTPSAKTSTSAVGLLCRMYTGWGPDEEPLSRGIARLAGRGPDPNAVYENFYLSQVLIQADHPAWPRWNAKNRDELIRQQAVIGHETGSWFFADPETAAGGRLAHTALAVLTLEVYYRLLPIYSQNAVGGRAAE